MAPTSIPNEDNMIPAKCGFCPIDERLPHDGSAGSRRAVA